MSNTNIPPNSDPVLTEIRGLLSNIVDRNPIVDRLHKNNVRELQNLKTALIQFSTPMIRLQDSFKRMDESNRKITQMGTTYAKLQASVEKNSTVLSNGLVSQRELTNAIAQNYDRGVRINNGAIMELTTEMIGTGQDLGGLMKMNADLVVQTGGNTAAVQQINKTNKEVSDKYGVSNQRLIESLNSLKGVMDKASMFGPDAVASFGSIATELKGRTGGKNIDGGLQALFDVLGPGTENLAASRLLGAGGLRQRIAAGGQIGTSDLAPIFENLERILGSSNGEFKVDIAAARSGLGKQQIIQLKMLNDAMKGNNALTEEEKATEKEKYASVENIQQRARNFYDNTSLQIVKGLGSINTTLITATMAVMQLGGGAGALAGLGGGTFFQGDPNAPRPFTKGQARKARIGNMLKTGGGRVMRGGALGMGVMAAGSMLGGEEHFGNSMGMMAGGAALGSIFPGPGTAVGAIGGLILGGILDIAKYTKTTSEATGEQAKIEREKARAEALDASRRQSMAIYQNIEYLRSRTNIESEEALEVSRSAAGTLRQILNQLSKGGTTATGRS